MQIKRTNSKQGDRSSANGRRTLEEAEGRGERRKWMEEQSRCVMGMDQLLTERVIIPYCKHGPVKLKTKDKK